MAPKGRPTSSTERMRLKRLREMGLAPPVSTCKTCGRQLKAAAGSGKAFDLGLCWQCWKKTDEGKLDRRKLNLRREIWAVGYVATNNRGEHEFHTNVRAALRCECCKPSMAESDCLIAAVWSDGTVTTHPGLNSRNAVGLTPEAGDPVIEDVVWFHEQVPPDRRTWFEA